MGSPERRGFRYCTVCCSLVALLKGPHNNPTSVYRHFSLVSATTGRHVLAASPAGIGCGGCHRGAEMRPGCALGVPSVRGRGLLLTTGGRPGSTVPFVVRPQSLPLINTMGGRAGLGLRVTHSDPYALQKEKRESESLVLLTLLGVGQSIFGEATSGRLGHSPERSRAETFSLS